MSIDKEMMELLSGTNRRPLELGKRYFFEGDLNQMAIAKQTAERLGVKVHIEGGIPFVMDKKDYDKVTKHIIDQRLEGWHHYVTHEEYLRMKGK